MKSIISFFIVAIFIIISFSCEDDASRLSFLPGLRKASPDDFAGIEPIPVNSLKVPMFLDDGTKLDSTLSFFEIIINNNVAPFPYIDDSGHIKAIVFSQVTGNELELWKNIANEYLYNNPDSSIHAKEFNLTGKKAIPFSLKSIDNKYYSLEELNGNIFVINFWFVACKACIEEIPLLNDIAKKYQSNKVTFLAITFDTKEKIDNFLKSRRFDYNIIAESMKIISDYNIRNFPTHLIIDGDLNIVYHQIGFNKDTINDLDRKIESLLAIN